MLSPVPETANRGDWPRLAARAINYLLRMAVNWGALGNYVNDAAAAAGGVPIGGVYRNGSVLMVRVA